MKKILLFTFIALSLICSSQDEKKNKNLEIIRVNFNLNFGNAFNFPTYLKIHQNGNEPIETLAKYTTKGFKAPIYWDYRLEIETSSNLIGLRSTHHKLHLSNLPAEISTFSITHGYNLVMIYYGWKRKYFDFLIGTGIAFSHPEGVVRNQYIALEEGISLYGGKYRLTAPNFELEIKRKWYLTERIFANTGGRLIAGYARPKIKNGYVETYPIGFHWAIGMGIDFYKRKKCIPCQ